MPKRRSDGTSRSFDAVARELAAAGRRFYARGWVLGTSGNFSAVLARNPLRLAITASAVDKGALGRGQILRIDERGGRLGRGNSTPSAETLLHLEIVRRRGAGAVLHTHSVWSTLLSDAHAAHGGLELSGFEMLKGLTGVTTHEHVERVPIIPNDQNMARLAGRIGETLDRAPGAHGLLLQGHGLYTWGASLAEAVRQVEIMEFLFEAIGRRASYHGREVSHGAAAHS